MNVHSVAFAIVAISWLVFCLAFLMPYLKVRRERAETDEQRKRSLRAPASMYGALLEFTAVAIVFAARAPEAGIGSKALAAGAVLAPASTLFAAAAFRELGRQLRIKAVVTEDHMLIESGPYALVRHPIFLALLGLLIASGLVLTNRVALLGAVAVYLIGTEIRVHAEEGILQRRFGAAFDTYRRRVPAYLPFLR